MSVVASAVTGAAAHTNYCMKMGTIPMLKARKVAAAAMLAVAGLTLPCRGAGSTSSFESFPEAPHVSIWMLWGTKNKTNSVQNAAAKP